jgi:hypothetical protein
MLLFILWMIGTWVMWLKAHKELKLRDGVQVPVRYRAVLDLAAALNSGQGAPTFTNSLLEEHVKSLRGGAIAAENPRSSLRYSFRATILPWIKEHKWWVLVCAITTGPLLVPVVSCTAVALLIGRTTAVRVLLLICGFSVVVIVVAPTFVLYLWYAPWRPPFDYGAI